MAARMWLRCVFGPHLHRIHHHPFPYWPYDRVVRTGWNYQPGSLEKHADKILGCASAAWYLCYYSSPLLLCFLYGKGYICSASQYVATTLLCLLGVVCLRGLGRLKNAEYIEFLCILDEAMKNQSPDNKKKLRCYNFDYSYWPVDFSWTEVSNPKSTKPSVSLLKHQPQADTGLHSLRTFAYHVVSYLMVHTFGRRMLYPGSVGLLQKAMRPMLEEGQAKLVEKFGGQRNKLLACDGNQIDTMFVDRRDKQKDRVKAQTLVICCEGNAGFYEVGCMYTPLEDGYSVLGWNHPGFGGSTGVPLPQNEANAMDAVIQFAVHKLRFPLCNIVIYAWSIGGFTASWAAMSYPEIQSVVLDATFDDLLPLALKAMPGSWCPLVQYAVRQYLNLNVSEQLLKYQGPVLLVRRSRDEIMATRPMPNFNCEHIVSNRGNDLVLNLLTFRYPKIMTYEAVTVVKDWLTCGSPELAATVYNGYKVDDNWCDTVLESYHALKEVEFPWNVGEDLTTKEKQHLALFLARKHVRILDTTHCTPLPASEFQPPRDFFRKTY
ncbi:phosphatidylserine lipase ABHD16A isoform X1 [Syngnathus typhle]|uniref:phosphatidylserine lipase ABHD16A isoform X1 n=1 Tax=Syngnathus typhle TaxID=161592 RepID=UPI002A6AC6B0|nr:phosphatidylserine lipase ABHD16A isoform X1 [Syngnathus typhle]